jgi:hypothetical protein
MKLRHFSIRDLLWLTALVAVLVAWLVDHRRLMNDIPTQNSVALVVFVNNTDRPIWDCGFNLLDANGHTINPCFNGPERRSSICVAIPTAKLSLLEMSYEFGDEKAHVLRTRSDIEANQALIVTLNPDGKVTHELKKSDKYPISWR